MHAGMQSKEARHAKQGSKACKACKACKASVAEIPNPNKKAYHNPQNILTNYIDFFSRNFHH